MPATITFFPVGNGDMTLIKLNDKDQTTILIDVNIRNAADDPNHDACDVASELRKRINKDGEGRPYVDTFLLSHPDKDHCTGLSKHFHLAPLSDYNYEPPDGEERKIVIREIWSSPMVFRRASKNHSLSPDATAFNTEAKRRVKLYRETTGVGITDGDRIMIIGEDENGKTDDLSKILVKVGENFSMVNGKENQHINMRVLGPLPKQEEEENEKSLIKNHSSVIIRFAIAADSNNIEACLFLTGGDAEVAIWENLWAKHKSNLGWLQYNLLQAPHHCSWHVLSYDSWSNCDDPKVNPDAKSALSQAKSGAFIVASSNTINDETPDPPCVGAKDEYVNIVNKDGVKGKLICTEEYPTKEKPEPLEFSITAEGPQEPARKKGSYLATAGMTTTREPLSHG